MLYKEDLTENKENKHRRESLRFKSKINPQLYSNISLLLKIKGSRYVALKYVPYHQLTKIVFRRADFDYYNGVVVGIQRR